ncbi:hypothetical protein IJ579_07300 [bacterium]|nr:hypothetical protein [bacterium]
MKLLEIKNNLAKLSYEQGEAAVLGKFLILASPEKSYVAQFVNLKSDTTQTYAIARLMFTFTPDGVVDDYDGSVPSMDSELSLLHAGELLDILPVETPVKIGTLAQQEDILNLDISVFEHNFTVFANRDIDRISFISNCTRQLFQMKEKSVIIDTDNLFEDFPKIKFAKDFKLPLNAEAIDFLFDYELSDIDATTKAVIQDIFYNVQQYIKTLEGQFLPINSFVDVVAAQYKETQMPELALLKNKLLKYRDENIFANTQEEFLSFNLLVSQKNCSIVDVHNIGGELQKVVFSFIHSQLEEFSKYIYLFIPLNDENSDKKLIKSLINNNHIFTTMITNSDYKYSQELKAHAQNIMLFTPLEPENEMTPYSTFLSKLNPGECIVYGTLTHDIPFILNIYDLELPLTKEDVLGEKYRFVPVTEELHLVDSENNPVPEIEAQLESVQQQDQSNEEVDETNETEEIVNSIPEIFPTAEAAEQIQPLPETEELSEETLQETDLPQEENFNADEELLTEDSFNEFEDLSEGEDSFEAEILPNEDEEIVSVDEFGNEEFQNPNAEDISGMDSLELTEEDLDFLDSEAVISEPSIQESDTQTVVPVYPAEEPVIEEVISDFNQGDTVSHPRYGRGVVEKIIKYGNKTLCSISFDNVGRRLLDPSVSEFEKI